MWTSDGALLKARRVGAMAMALAVVALLVAAPAASAAGVTVITGAVTIDGVLAPAGTLVRISLADGSGAVIASATTGANGLMAHQYRADVATNSAWEGRTIIVQALVGGALSPSIGPPAATFAANRVLSVDIAASTRPPGVAVEFLLAPLINIGTLELASSFNYDLIRYDAFVPGLPGNPLTTIVPHSVLFLTITRDAVVVVSGVTFQVRAQVMTPIPVGSNVTFQLR